MGQRCRARPEVAGAEVLAYASRTGTRRNLRLLSAHGWRLVISAAGTLNHEGMAYELDNGAWRAHALEPDVQSRCCARIASGSSDDTKIA